MYIVLDASQGREHVSTFHNMRKIFILAPERGNTHSTALLHTDMTTPASRSWIADLSFFI